jgi:hypothetical protein
MLAANKGLTLIFFEEMQFFQLPQQNIKTFINENNENAKDKRPKGLALS